jgi:hypothetical protein
MKLKSYKASGLDHCVFYVSYLHFKGLPNPLNKTALKSSVEKIIG